MPKQEISRYLHYADNSTLHLRTSADYDRLGKVRPSYKRDSPPCTLQAGTWGHDQVPGQILCQTIYAQETNHTWDQGLGFGGQFKRLFLPPGRVHGEGSTEHNLGARVVKHLTQDFKDKWHMVFFDNFFTSKALICDLEAMKIYSNGTARKD